MKHSKLNRRTAMFAVVLATAMAPFAFAHAQEFPTQSIRIVVPFAAGGTTDLLARLVAEGMRTRLGQTVVVDNKGGAGGNLGAAEVARAKPDGYTLMLATPGPLAINQYMYASPGYDAEKQLIAVSNIAKVPNVLMASPQSGIKDMADFFKRAKASPGKLNYGSAGSGSTSHLAVELIKSMAGISVTHIPYRGVAPAMNDLMAGQIDLLVDNLPTAMPMIAAGKVVPIGVTTKTRVDTVPNVAPIGDALPGYELASWFGIVASAGTPDAVVKKLATAISDFVKEDATREKIAKLGAAADPTTPEEFTSLIKSERVRFKALVERAHIKVD